MIASLLNESAIRIPQFNTERIFMKNPQGDIAVIGLAVMGQNLILNMNDHGFTVVAYNRTASKVDEFLNGPAKGTRIIGAKSIREMIDLLKQPRKIMLMVKAGTPVDDFIESLLPYLDRGDLVIDGGNSHYPDTIRRERNLAGKGILYIGTGISGGEEGARNGPSIMPGGNPQAWPLVKELFRSIAAKTPDGMPCCDWVGPEGAGHFVKMVHNGIEYGDMQLIAEAYDLMRRAGMDAGHMQRVFAGYNKGQLNSYLIEITADILGLNDTDGIPLVEKIVDAAGQKGTGKWTVSSSLDFGVPITLIGEAVFARSLSSLVAERRAAAQILTGPAANANPSSGFTDDIGKALLASKIVSYAQGYMLLRAAGRQFNWDLNYGGIALMWRGGCIIRSAFLDRIKEAYDRKSDLENLLLDNWFRSTVEGCQSAWRRVAGHAVARGVPIPAMSSALAFFDGYRSGSLPANLLQAQRDYFGAHGYERIDKPAGEFFHTNWTGKGGSVASSSYVV
jgi:6-phosphogluconate dehydrogenase